jgi:hypothetical protein
LRWQQAVQPDWHSNRIPFMEAAILTCGWMARAQKKRRARGPALWKIANTIEFRT